MFVCEVLFCNKFCNRISSVINSVYSLLGGHTKFNKKVVYNLIALQHKHSFQTVICLKTIDGNINLHGKLSFQMKSCI